MKEKIKEYLLEYMSRNSAEDIMYDIDELIEKEKADEKAKIIEILERELTKQNNPNSKFEETIVLNRDFLKKIIN